jgi:hypothetical protein
MSGPAFWESLVKAGRTIYFPNIPLRLVAPNPEGLSKGLNVVTFITVPSTSKVRAAPCHIVPPVSCLPFSCRLPALRWPPRLHDTTHTARGLGVSPDAMWSRRGRPRPSSPRLREDG